MTEVFILGAGFSKAISNSMPLMKDLSENVLDRYIQKDSIPGEIESMIRDDFEKGLTFLAQEKPWLREADNLRHKALYLDLTDVIREILLEKCRDPGVWGTNNSPPWLDNLVAYWHAQRSAIITLNYDTLIERVVSSGSRQFARISNTGMLYPVALRMAGERVANFGGVRVGETLKLFKLHGSINWFCSGRSDFFGEEIYYVPCSGGIDGLFKAAEGQDAESIHWNSVRDKTALIIPPVLDKNLFFQHEALRSLWFQAGQAIKNASRIVCMGYSLPISDLTMAQFLRSSAPEKRVPFEMVDVIGKVDHFSGVLGSTYQFSQKLNGPDCIKQFVAGLPAT